MELDIINKLYLELSQVATATTKREIELTDCLESLLSNPTDSHAKVRAQGMIDLINMNRA